MDRHRAPRGCVSATNTTPACDALTMSANGSPFGFGSTRRAGASAGAADGPTKHALVARMKPGTPREFEDSINPDPHVFMRRDEGLFPINEGTVIAGLARDGKTIALVGIATALRLGINVGGLAPTMPNLGTLFFTAEDTRPQMLRKVAACAYAADERRQGDGEVVRKGLLVLDVNDDYLSSMHALVEMNRRQPQVGRIVAPLCEAIELVQKMHDVRLGLAVFETASTLNDGDEANLTLRLLADSVRRVARHCELASVLSHHLSQAAIPNIRDLSFSSADIRGGTALVSNARQNAILVSLGSNRYPFTAENDKRTMLRRVIDDASPQSERGEMVVVLVPLDASKAALPPPIYFRQYLTPYGPALLPIPTPDLLAPMSWQEQVAYLRASSASTREAGRAAARDAAMWEAIEAVRALEAEATPATVNAVSKRCGHSTDWALPHLNAGVVAGRLTRRRQAVPRSKGLVDVYSIPRDSSAPEQSPEDTQ